MNNTFRKVISYIGTQNETKAEGQQFYYYVPYDMSIPLKLNQNYMCVALI